MDDRIKALAVDASEVEATGITIPGATEGGIEAQLLNIDHDRGVVATIIHLKAGAEIPAHFHMNGAEAHYILEGELIDGGKTFGPGSYLTHAAGVVHGPHRSEQGCKVLTVQGARIASEEPDFHIVANDASDGPPAEDRTRQEAGTVVAERPEPGRSSPTTPPDMVHEPVDADEVPETQKAGPTDDNPTNPMTG